MEKRTSWKNLANYDYLGAYSLQGVVDEVALTIKLVKKERVTGPGGASEDCIVVYFEETNKDGVVVKPMVMNKTNCKIIEKVYGTPYIEDWIGKKIIIYATTTKFARDVVPCLRVKAEIPKEPVYACCVCGKVIDKDFYNASVEKYGNAYCSKECLESKQENEQNNK